MSSEGDVLELVLNFVGSSGNVDVVDRVARSLMNAPVHDIISVISSITKLDQSNVMQRGNSLDDTYMSQPQSQTSNLHELKS